MNMFSYIISGIVLGLWDIVFFHLIAKYYGKKCNYDCSKCKCWSCNKYQCMKNSKGKMKDE